MMRLSFKRLDNSGNLPYYKENIFSFKRFTDEISVRQKNQYRSNKTSRC